MPATSSALLRSLLLSLSLEEELELDDVPSIESTSFFALPLPPSAAHPHDGHHGHACGISHFVSVWVCLSCVCMCTSMCARGSVSTLVGKAVEGEGGAPGVGVAGYVDGNLDEVASLDEPASLSPRPSLSPPRPLSSFCLSCHPIVRDRRRIFSAWRLLSLSSWRLVHVPFHDVPRICQAHRTLPPAVPDPFTPTLSP